MNPKIDILYFDAASGHRSAADALRVALMQKYPNGGDSDIRMVNVTEIFERRPLGLGHPVRLGIEYFNWGMRRERYFGVDAMFNCTTFWSNLVIRSPFMVRGVSEFWTRAGRRPDAVVSVTPMFNSLVYTAARKVNPEVRCITIPVDYSEACPGYWFTPRHRQTYLIGDPALHQWALRRKVPAEDIRPLSGMPVDPRFYSAPALGRQQLLASLNLDQQLPVGVISFGGQGTVNVLRSIQALAKAETPTNLICLCGRNAAVKAAIEQLQTPFPKVALAYRPEPPVDIMLAADFLIGKPGTMTLTESLISKTPYIFIRSGGLRCAQGLNEAWVLARGLGLAVESPEETPDAVREVLGSDRFLTATNTNRHRGIFDAVDEIGHLLHP